jgi:hypothetical protein
MLLNEFMDGLGKTVQKNFGRFCPKPSRKFLDGFAQNRPDFIFFFLFRFISFCFIY